MVIVAIIAVLWLVALGITLLARDVSLDVERALSSDEEIVSTPELDPQAVPGWSDGRTGMVKGA